MLKMFFPSRPPNSGTIGCALAGVSGWLRPAFAVDPRHLLGAQFALGIYPGRTKPRDISNSLSSPSTKPPTIPNVTINLAHPIPLCRPFQ